MKVNIIALSIVLNIFASGMVYAQEHKTESETLDIPEVSLEESSHGNKKADIPIVNSSKPSVPLANNTPVAGIIDGKGAVSEADFPEGVIWFGAIAVILLIAIFILV